jgi:acetylornithine deacetylase/succinyl-diaminopimelate desuccinylase-like protein
MVLGMTMGAASAATPADPTEPAFRALYQELVEINTTRSSGSCTRAAEAMRARLLAAGLPAGDAQVLAPADRPQDGALVALLRGRDAGLKPLLLLAHIDVVEARREDWVRDPFKLVEEGGWFYARGASDDKAMAAVFTDSLVRYRKEGYVPHRGIKLALTCGEETPEIFNSVRWLTSTRPDVLDAGLRSTKARAASWMPAANRRRCRCRPARRSIRISSCPSPTRAVTARVRRSTTRSCR